MDGYDRRAISPINVRRCEMTENKEEKQEDKKQESDDTGKGDKPKELSTAEQLDAKIERLEKANEEARSITAEAKAKEAIAGSTEAGQEAPKPKKLTDIEYAEALERGEVNPLKEDGFLK